ncbi:LAMI_0H16556g1_1 [Lachancea mirantina]|uniref:LAMI_0H16556g1_1 n=1 Tax=Lachancea mirantina TaxID=1230905 RepID=A0A1G4KJ33_9SACH|nr:LAMI_0H16556g1_1 [Lachancea mirantina]
MILPIEILEQVVTSGLDSFETSMSWSEISPRFQDVVRQKLGIVVITDLSYRRHEPSPGPLCFKRLSGDQNTFITSSDQYRLEELRDFVESFDYLLIVVATDRAFSDPLMEALTRLAEIVASNSRTRPKDICLIYKTGTNYLSKMYFREFWLHRKKMGLNELHILGVGQTGSLDLCDLDMIFKITYLHNVHSLYSLNIPNARHKLIAPDLNSIRQLEAVANVRLEETFASCPNMAVIEQFRLPSGIDRSIYELPACESFAFMNFNPDLKYTNIDGHRVREELTIKTALKMQNLELKNLEFSQIYRLNMHSSTMTLDEIVFKDCFFPNVEVLDLSSNQAHISWASLQSSCSNIALLRTSVRDLHDLRWLAECPFHFRQIDFTSGKTKPTIHGFSKEDILEVAQSSNCSRLIKDAECIEVEVREFWDFIMLQLLILPNLASNSRLQVTINQSASTKSIYDSATDSNIPLETLLQSWGFNYAGSHIRLNVPKIKEFAFFCDSPDSDPSNLIEESKLPKSGLIYADAAASDTSFINNAISPSAFRRNSLAGADSSTARRNSVLSIGSQQFFSSFKRRSSSHSSDSAGGFWGGNSRTSCKSMIQIIPSPVDPVHTFETNLHSFPIFESACSLSTAGSGNLVLVGDRLEVDGKRVSESCEEICEDANSIYHHPFISKIKSAGLVKIQIKFPVKYKQSYSFFALSAMRAALMESFSPTGKVEISEESKMIRAILLTVHL